jgi:hypothetical protein
MTADPWVTEDPWAESPTDTVEAEPEYNTNGGTVSNVNVTSEDPITLTFKQSGGYDAPWTVLRAKSVDESLALVKEAVEKGLFKAVTWAAGEFAGKPTVTANVQQAPAQQSYQQPAQQAPQQQQGYQGDGRTCQHGVMTYKEGFNQAKGTNWKAYFCPTPKNTPGQCKPTFVS